MKDTAKLQSIFDTLDQLEIDTACFQEINDSLPEHHRRETARAFGISNKRTGIVIAAEISTKEKNI